MKKIAFVTGATGQNGSYLTEFLLTKGYEVHTMNKKTALVTGTTGQDGSYLAELLLSKNYEVHSINRRTSTDNRTRLTKIPDQHMKNFHEHCGDLTDTTGLTSIINEIKPTEIYNLGAQSHVGISFKCPEFTADVNALGPLRILEAIRRAKLEDSTRFYQASTSELFGKVAEIPQTEKTILQPRSPYAVAKLYAYWITINYREAYNMYACNGILFNHESPRRGEMFVTRKITKAAARIFYGLEKCLYLGNIDALRDWGHAKDYVEAQWLMLQQSKPEDFVISSGKQHSVRDFVNLTFKHIGVELEWTGKNTEERGIIKAITGDRKTNLRPGDTIVRIDEKFYRPAEVETLLGSSEYARKKLGWTPKISFEMLVQEMVDNDMSEAYIQSIK